MSLLKYYLEGCYSYILISFFKNYIFIISLSLFSNILSISAIYLSVNFWILNPNNDGKVIRLNFPELTEERRKELAKEIRKIAEEARISIRSLYLL